MSYKALGVKLCIPLTFSLQLLLPFFLCCSHTVPLFNISLAVSGPWHLLSHSSPRYAHGLLPHFLQVYLNVPFSERLSRLPYIKQHPQAPYSSLFFFMVYFYLFFFFCLHLLEKELHRKGQT